MRFTNKQVIKYCIPAYGYSFKMAHIYRTIRYYETKFIFIGKQMENKGAKIQSNEEYKIYGSL